MIFLHAPPGTSSVIYGMAETLNSRKMSKANKKGEERPPALPL
jgi:hypothetical protein